jgi:hypothetical protein
MNELVEVSVWPTEAVSGLNSCITSSELAVLKSQGGAVPATTFSPRRSPALTGMFVGKGPFTTLGVSGPCSVLSATTSNWPGVLVGRKTLILKTSLVSALPKMLRDVSIPSLGAT